MIRPQAGKTVGASEPGASPIPTERQVDALVEAMDAGKPTYVLDLDLLAASCAIAPDGTVTKDRDFASGSADKITARVISL